LTNYLVFMGEPARLVRHNFSFYREVLSGNIYPVDSCTKERNLERYSLNG